MDGFQSNGFVKVASVGTSKSGKVTATARLKADYDPGLGFTTQTAVAVAAALVPKAREGKGAGFGSPVSAVGGAALKEALKSTGVTVDVKLKSA